MKDPHPTNEEAGDGPPTRTDERNMAPLALDFEKYRGYLDDFALSEDQQNELLETLWHIMRTFVELGYGLDSVQNLFSGIIVKTLREENAALERKDHFNRIAEPIGENKERSCR